jgi:hypothetical protein
MNHSKLVGALLLAGWLATRLACAQDDTNQMLAESPLATTNHL